MIDISFDKYWTVQERRYYPWPCKPEPERKLELWPGDVLTKDPDGSVTKHNGLCMVGIRVPSADLVLVETPVRLVC
jgi:hypothetical protein